DRFLGLLEVLRPAAGELRRVDVLQSLDVGLGDELVVDDDLFADVGRGLVGRRPVFHQRLAPARLARAGAHARAAAGADDADRVFVLGLGARPPPGRGPDLEEVARRLDRLLADGPGRLADLGRAGCDRLDVVGEAHRPLEDAVDERDLVGRRGAAG